MKQTILIKTLSILLLLINVLGKNVTAQTVISGTVTNNKQKPMIGVSVTIKDSYDGATTDSAGKFKFTSTEKGKKILEFTSLNYKPQQQEVELNGTLLNVTIVMREEITELTAVVISAGSFEASDRKRAVAILDPIDIVTTASANGDVTGAIKTLPGVQQVGESEGLFVRGGSASETKTFIDGSLVNNFFYSGVPNIAQFSRFSPFLFKGTVFTAGGYSALYGQALSAALILESIDLPDQSTGNFSISVLGLSGGYQHLAKNKKSSFGFSYNYNNLAPAFKIIKQRQDFEQYPAYHTADANFRIKTSATGIIKYYGYFSFNKLAFAQNSIDSIPYLEKFALKNHNHFHNLSYRENLGNGWKLQLGMSYSNNADDINSNMQKENKEDVLLTGLEFKNFGLDTKGEYWNAKLVLEKRLAGLTAIRWGGEYNQAKDVLDYEMYNGTIWQTTIKEKLAAAFAEADFYFTNKLALKTGLRYEYASLVNKANLAPRLSLAYKLKNSWQASLAYGMFYQNPEKRYLPSANALSFMKATHYIGQLQRVKNNQTLRTELFYKKYDNLLKTNLEQGQQRATDNNGFGDASGIEFFWRDKRTLPFFDYWVSYSYVHTKRDYLNFPYAITPNFVAKHNASLVTKKFVQSLKTNFNTSYTFASGRPYYNIVKNGNSFVFNDRGTTPNYHNVSFSLNYLPNIGKTKAKMFPIYVLQVSNIFNIKQIYGYQYSYNSIRKEAIMPTSRMFVFIGAFISFGVDRSDDVMNNAL